MGKSGKIAKVYKLENQWSIDSNLEVVTQKGLDKPLHNFWRVSLTDSQIPETKRRFTHKKEENQ